jgi:hypothetical protein
MHLIGSANTVTNSRNIKANAMNQPTNQTCVECGKQELSDRDVPEDGFFLCNDCRLKQKAEFEAMAHAHGHTYEEHIKYWLFKMLAEEAAITEANEIVEPHLTGDDWKLGDD